MNLLGMLDKLDDIVYKPIELVTDWAREPLKRAEHRRDLEKTTALLHTESELRIKEKNADVDLSVRRETEVKRIWAEIEEWKKDKEFERRKAVSDAIIRYQEELKRLNVSALTAIGHMQLDLREKAQSLVYEKTIKYKELQELATKEASIDLKRIEEDFPGNERAKEILEKAVEMRLVNIIDTAHNFLIELNSDIKMLNQNINILAEQGHRFIEQHLDTFHVIDSASEETKQITGH